MQEISWPIESLYGEHFTKEALEEFGDFKIGHVIRTVKHADGLLAKEETALQGMILSWMMLWNGNECWQN
jgi:hypothetical protein